MIPPPGQEMSLQVANQGVSRQEPSSSNGCECGTDQVSFGAKDGDDQAPPDEGEEEVTPCFSGVVKRSQPAPVAAPTWPPAAAAAAAAAAPDF